MCMVSDQDGSGQGMYSEMIECNVVAGESSAFVSRSEQDFILCDQTDEGRRDVEGGRINQGSVVTK